jgi:WD40 repeat protein
VATGREVVALRAGKELVRSVAFSPEGEAVAWAADDGVVRVWDLRAGRERASLAGHDGHGGLLAGRRIAFLPDGRSLVLWTAGGRVRVWGSVP